MSEIQRNLIANSDMKTGNTEVKNLDLEDGSRKEAGGSQRDSEEYNENEAKIEQVFSEKSGESALTNEHENSQNRAGSIRNMSSAMRSLKKKLKLELQRLMHRNLVPVEDFVKGKIYKLKILG